MFSVKTGCDINAWSLVEVMLCKDVPPFLSSFMGMDFVDLSWNKEAAEMQLILIKYAGVRGSVSVWKGSVLLCGPLLFFKRVKFPFYFILCLIHFTILFCKSSVGCFYMFSIFLSHFPVTNI